MNHDRDDAMSNHQAKDDGAHSHYPISPIGLPHEVFRRLMRGIGDHQEGLALWRIRMYLRISLREAASHAEISAGYLWHLEHGQRHARQWTLIRVCLSSLSLSPAQTITIFAHRGTQSCIGCENSLIRHACGIMR